MEKTFNTLNGTQEPRKPVFLLARCIGIPLGSVRSLTYCIALCKNGCHASWLDSRRGLLYCTFRDDSWSWKHQKKWPNILVNFYCWWWNHERQEALKLDQRIRWHLPRLHLWFVLQGWLSSFVFPLDFVDVSLVFYIYRFELYTVLYSPWTLATKTNKRGAATKTFTINSTTVRSIT